MAGTSPIIDATPDFVTGTFDATDVRQGVLGNALPGLLSTADFVVTQNGTPNMSVNISTGNCVVTPEAATQQGSYLARSGLVYAANDTATYNTLSDGAITWGAAHATLPRNDLLCIEVADTDQAGSYTGWKFRVINGTADALATHQLITTYWPAIPTGCVPIAAVNIPALDTTIGTAQITNLKPITPAWGRATVNSIAAEESTTGTAMGRLVTSNGTADFVCVYVPNLAASIVDVFFKAQVKVDVAAGNHDFALFVNSVQVQIPVLRAAPVNNIARFTLGDNYSQITSNIYRPGSATSGLFGVTADSTTDQTQATTPTVVAAPSTTTGYPTGDGATWIPLERLSSGWNVIELRYQASANVISAKNRILQAKVRG